MATLVLQDGTTFAGTSFGASLDGACPERSRGAQDDTFGSGEVVFNTGMVGYPESCTDPSYRGQILVFTYPLIGNYGVPSEGLNEYGFARNFESEDVHVRAVVCAQVSEDFSHHTAVESFPDWLKRHGIPGITGVDTRALTKKLREKGVMLGRIVEDECHAEERAPKERVSRSMPAPSGPVPFETRSAAQSAPQGDTLDIEDPNLRNLVAEVSCKEAITYEPRPCPRPCPTVVAFDCGMKRNILRSFLQRGVRVVRVPWNFDLARADFPYDGVFISNGPGDPKMCTETIKQVAYAIGRNVPTFGICLGIQLMALAIGGNTYKLKYGHRGANQPCVEERSAISDQRSERCIITSQNHGFAVDEKMLPVGWRVWFRNGNDGTVEGIRHESGKFFAVQFHPEATPGPEEAGYLFDEFLGVLRGKEVRSKA